MVRINGETREYGAGTSYQDIAEEFQPYYKHQIVLAFAGGNHLQELRKRVEKDCELRLSLRGILSVMRHTKGVCASSWSKLSMMWRDMTGSKGCGFIFPWIKDITAQWKAEWS